MKDKKGILDFFKGWGTISEEEQQQRQHAMSQDSGTNEVETFVISEDVELFAIEKVEEILHLAGFSGKVKCKNKLGRKLYLEIFDAGDDLGRIIGKGGATLQALQLLVRHFLITKFKESYTVLLDAGDYLKKQERILKQKAFKAVEQVKASGENVPLEPMSAYERRFVHTLLDKNKGVQTFSEGTGAQRHIVVAKRDDS